MVTELGKPQRDLFTALNLDPPKKIIEITTPTADEEANPADASVA